MDLDQHNCEYKPAGLKIRVISDAKCDDNEESGYEDILFDQRDKDVNSKVKIKEYNTRLEFNIRTRAMDVHTNHSHFTTNFKSFKVQKSKRPIGCCLWTNKNNGFFGVLGIFRLPLYFKNGVVLFSFFWETTNFTSKLVTLKTSHKINTRT